METIIVVGASLAGLRAVERLRQRGYAGRIVWVGEEPHLPYDRPPLSKEVLQGSWEVERTALRRDPYEDLDLDLRLARRATALDPTTRTLSLDDGTSEVYDALLVATGAAARPLPGQPDLEGIHLLRTLDDSLAVRDALEHSPRVVVVGAGFIGAEVAASARARGLEVVMVEPQPAPMLRGLGAEMGEVCGQIHRDQGVDLRCSLGVEALEGSGRVERVRLSDGSTVDADLVVVGIGARPATDWLESSGIALDDGVLCDDRCRASAPGVYAAGDVARFDNPLFGESMRIEHWSNAVDQGVHAADSMLAGEAAEPYVHVPWFWSDQYDLTIQFAGRMRANDEVRVIEGSVAERKFAALYGREGRLVGVLAFSLPRAQRKFRKQIAAGMSFGDALAAAGV